MNAMLLLIILCFHPNRRCHMDVGACVCVHVCVILTVTEGRMMGVGYDGRRGAPGGGGW